MAYYEKRYNGWRAKINWYDAKGKRHAKSKQGFATNGVGTRNRAG